MLEIRGWAANPVLLIAGAFAFQGLGACAAQAPKLVPYVAENRAYALHKPADWTVREDRTEDDMRILVRSADGNSTVEFFVERNTTGRQDAVELLSSFRKRMALGCKELSVSEAFVAKDGTRAVATMLCRGAASAVKGRYFFEAGAAWLSVQGFLAPESALQSQRPLLLNILASLSFARRANAQTASRAQAAPEPVYQAQLVPRQAQDGSLSIRIPADWTFLAAGGRLVSGSRDGGMGFIFTSISGNPMVPNATIAQGIIPTTYKPPPQALGLFLHAFGHRNIKILSAAPDRATMQECIGTLRSRCDAQDLVARWTSSNGAECMGAIKMINMPPSQLTGIWNFIISGIWGPESGFPRYYPLLKEVGESFSINDQFARRYIQQGLENLRRLQAQTAAAMQDLNRAREQNQRDWEARQERKDYMDSKWDDYRRGNSYWVSELEGGKIYKTDTSGTRDTVTGDYYGGQGYNWVNFEGQNPRYASENMRELSSWEVEHGRRPPK